MGGGGLFRALSDEEIGLEKDTTALLYKSLNPAN
jgi:hypothetical protein